jgi:transcriptional regulator with XRE-family HTH domain
MEVKDHKLLARLVAIQDISTRELARDAGWRSHSYLQRLIRGEVHTLRPDPAILIAQRLQVPVESLFLARTSTDRERLDQEYRSQKRAAAS